MEYAATYKHVRRSDGRLSSCVLSSICQSHPFSPSSPQARPGPQTIVPFIAPRAFEAIFVSAFCTISSVFLALVFRTKIYSFLLWGMNGIFRHYITHFLHPRAPTPFGSQNLLWMGAANAATMLTWEVSQSLLDFYSSLVSLLSLWSIRMLTSLEASERLTVCPSTKLCADVRSARQRFLLQGMSNVPP